MPQIGFQNVDFFEKMVANNLVAGQLRGPIFLWGRYYLLLQLCFLQFAYAL